MAVDRGVTREPGYRCDPVADAQGADDDVVISPDGAAELSAARRLARLVAGPAQNRGERLDEATP
jgi:hypothetical protein